MRNPHCARSPLWARTEAACGRNFSYSFSKSQGLPPALTVPPGAAAPLKAIGIVNTPRGSQKTANSSHVGYRTACKRTLQQPSSSCKAPSLCPARHRLWQHGTRRWDRKHPRLFSHGEPERLRAPHSRPITKHRATPNSRLRATQQVAVVARPAHCQHNPSKSTSTSQLGHQFIWKFLH